MQTLKHLLRKTTGNQLLNQAKSGLVCEEVQRLIDEKFGRMAHKDIASISYVAGEIKIRATSVPLRQRLRYYLGDIQKGCNEKFGEHCVKKVSLR